MKQVELMKQKHLPMDFASIKEHERSFLVNAYMRKQQRDAELKSKLKSLEQAYRPQIGQATQGKSYAAAKEEYEQTRKANPHAQKIAESLQSRERVKKYTEKLRAMNMVDEHLRPDLPSKILGPVNGKTESEYGRFGKEWNRKLNQHHDELKQIEAIKEKGMEYLNYGKSKAGRKDLKTVEEKEAEEFEERKKAVTKAQEIGKDYLKFAKNMAAKTREGGGVEIPSVLNHNISKELKGDDKAFVRARLDKMDTDVMMMEAKVRNKMINKDSIEVENAYLKNIKAKLSILEEL